MFVRQVEYNYRPGHGAQNDKPAWHLTNEKALFSFTKKVSSKCGLKFEINDKNETAEKIKENEKVCGQCLIVDKGRTINMNRWGSTGASQ